MYSGTSEDYLKQAGVRIRYRRIENALQHLGHELSIVPIQYLADKKDFSHDSYLISKCYDARALVITCLLKNQKKMVGIDLFDDYFSQTNDNRFPKLRYWLCSILQYIDFILCSTPAIAEVANQLAMGQKIHIMNDSSPDIDKNVLQSAIQSKMDYFNQSKVLTVGWFGIGDNPYFPVGLKDLVAFSGELASLRDKEFDIQLEILTNQRAMTADALAMLRRIPVPYTVDDWTEEQEAALLARSMMCFLPVNAQNFSIAKSLNRAVTTLVSGTQVLSCGYPLYEKLSPFIYRDPQQLINDLKNGSLALRKETIPDLIEIMEQWASPELEAEKLAKFIETCNAGSSPCNLNKPLIAVIHGKNTLGEIHKFVQKVGVLSIASPFCKEKLNFDLRFSFNSDDLSIYISEKYCSMLSKQIQNNFLGCEKIVDRLYHKINLSQLISNRNCQRGALNYKNTSINFTASYAKVMNDVAKSLQFLFPQLVYFYSENSKAPWWLLTDIPSYNLEVTP
ncbi:hypothetical protein EP47_03590 [Legionella norrlandica]|uniref:Glycosyltransferase n=1 Tax=Legionella norrlandica TaxID=1498499 RepID=A0A0A2SWA3_9GAMM|nr:hypothetical protein [Legionella norrlandica]KGP64016.1 hypothetical protein EP47_03590 [Legionella norrlandica]